MTKTERVVGCVYYDKECRLCCWLAKIGHKYIAPSLLWIGATYGETHTSAPLAVQSLIYEESGQYWLKSEAVRQILRAGGWRLTAWLIGQVPLSWRDKVYDFIAARRQKICHTLGACNRK
ncbi:MAG: DCC1-like thiol-disulfide oxidoreductase family protein [Bacteroidia bacterium]|nr:DCC1-like thiol-disulfide oxidoreductase family protein [Bacteroidia bacterium]MDW8235643.1 DCC1-like thiol-disulfide oxidoreductase family protein [Bacteroidia bacterium]